MSRCSTAGLLLGLKHWNLGKMPTQNDVPATFILSGDYENRVLEALRVAQHQVRLAQSGAAPRMQEALVSLEDALSDQLAWLENAAQDDKADADFQAALEQAAWQPLRAA